MLTDKRRRVVGLRRGILWCASLCLVFGAFAHAEGRSQLLFEQPTLHGTQNHVLVPLAVRRPPPRGVFALLLWQPNPFEPSGMLVPTAWRAGDKTGFYPSEPLREHQAGFRDTEGSSTAQVDGEVVGAYINSRDLPDGSNFYKMMITPQFEFPRASRPVPFTKQASKLVASLELQVPTAENERRGGSHAHVAFNLLFSDRKSDTRISYGCILFSNGRRLVRQRIARDKPTGNIMINGPVHSTNQWLTVLPGSETVRTHPWRGWREFRFIISADNFRAGLQALRSLPLGSNVSVNPADYALVRFHLNAELHYKTAPAELGWSMRSARITLEDAGP